MSKKKQRDLELFIVDIFIAIQKIKEYVKNFDNEEDFRHSSLHWDATIRQLEVIGEALNNLLDDDDFSVLSPDYFRKIVNFRNTIVHGYFGIDVDEVWNVICDKLDILNNDLHNLVKTKINLSTAIRASVEEYRRLNDRNIVNFLKSLEQ